jgi:NAD(P)-dependent dehydrogenase (short-subunit alcohol dehydrogenase family)
MPARAWLVVRWLPGREVAFVADSSFVTLFMVSHHAAPSMSTRATTAASAGSKPIRSLGRANDTWRTKSSYAVTHSLLMGITGRDCYTAAQGGIAVLTHSLTVEFAPQHVQVNAIAPSATMTDRVKKLMAGNPAIDKLAQSHLLGLTQPEGIANDVLYLTSDESRTVTGQILPVDSGVTIS